MLLWTSLSEDFDIKKGTLRIRQQRAGMIQTKEQYLFCYLALKDWYSSTNVTRMSDMQRIPRFQKLLAYKNQKWFHKSVTESVAQEILRSRPVGSFLVRPSNEHGRIAISFVNEGGNVIHHQIVPNDNGFLYNNKLYPTMLDVLKGNPHLFKHPLYK